MSDETKPASSADKKWKVDKGAGGVVYRISEGPAVSASATGNAKASAGRQTFVLMINPKGRNFGPAVDYWSWPKGRFDKEGEDKEQVALREVREEGGVNALWDT
jgi:hypothetical protein